MKKTVILVMAIAFVSTMAVAQQEEGAPQARNFDKSEMIKKRTDNMVQKYNLSEEQASKLLELNTLYNDSMRMGMPRQGGMMAPPQGEGGQEQQAEPNSDNGGDKQRPGGRGNRGRGGMGNPEVMKNYDAKLQEILTEEQYKQYTEDRAKAPQGGPRPQGGSQDGPQGAPQGGPQMPGNDMQQGCQGGAPQCCPNSNKACNEGQTE